MPAAEDLSQHVLLFILLLQEPNGWAGQRAPATCPRALPLTKGGRGGGGAGSKVRPEVIYTRRLFLSLGESTGDLRLMHNRNFVSFGEIDFYVSKVVSFAPSCNKLSD